jgi:hypothetical protein
VSVLQPMLDGRRGPVFIPIVYRLAAALEGITEDELGADAASAVYALSSAQQLFGLRAVVSHFQLGVEAQDGGAEVGLETTRRLVAQLGEAVPVLGVISGPRALAGLDRLEQLYSDVARAYCEAGAQGLLVAEGRDESAHEAEHDRSLSQLINVASFFAVPVLMLDPSTAVHELSGALVLADEGHGLAPAALDTPPAQWLQDGAVTLTDGELAPETEPEVLHSWCEAFAAVAR